MKLWKRNKPSDSPESYFAESEALAKVGTQVKLRKKHDSIPHYSTGVVLKAEQSSADKWQLLIQWRAPGTYTDASTPIIRHITFHRASKLFTRRYSKSQFDEYVTECTLGNDSVIDGPHGPLFNYHCPACGKSVTSAENKCGHCGVTLPA